MECLLNQQSMFLEDFYAPQTTATNVATTTITPASVEDFFVDQLLNLNNDDDEDEHQPQIDPGVVLVVKEEDQFKQDCSNKFSPCLSPPFDSVLSVPAEEADLEWLSHFVEESFSQFSTPYPPGFQKPKPKPKPNPGIELGFELYNGPSVTPSNLGKSRRSKRARTGGRVWYAARSDTSSPSSTAPCSPSSTEAGPCKKQKKKETGPSGGGGFTRRCSHCGVQKTPQWRTGPEGAKTLCNACGVRYKSGRLLPEYRPACSPTFSSELHSNSHRKVLEMRKNKETGEPESRGSP